MITWVAMHNLFALIMELKCVCVCVCVTIETNQMYIVIMTLWVQDIVFII